MKRRKYIATISATVSGLALAGCSGDGGDEQSIPKPEEDANPEDLLPEPPDGWEQTLSNEQDASIIGAEASYAGNYNNPDGREYAVEASRFASESEAGNSSPPDTEQFESYLVYVVNGVFTFSGRGPAGETPTDGDFEQLMVLMDNSSALTEEFIQGNNKL